MKRMKFDRSFQLPGEGGLRKKTYGGERGGGGGGGGVLRGMDIMRKLKICVFYSSTF